MAENTLDIVLRFLTDKNSLKKAQADVNSVAAGKNVGKAAIDAARDMGTTVNDVAKRWAGMAAMGGKTEQQILADVQAFKQMDQAAGQTAQQVANIDRNVRKMRGGMQGMGIGFAGFLLGMTGMQMQRLGTTLLSPIASYAKYAGGSSPISAQYLAAQKSIENSTLRIGQVMASTIAPLMEKAAKVVEGIASWVERNPGAAGTIAGAGAFATVGGGALIAVGQTVAGVSAVKMFLDYLKPAQTANTAAIVANTAATTANTAATGVGGAVKGAGATGLAAFLGPLKWITAAAVVSSVGAAAWGNSNRERYVSQVQAGTAKGPVFLPGGMKSEEARAELHGLSNAIDELGNSARDAAGNIIPDAATKAWVSFQQANLDAERQYEQERADIIKSYGQQRADLEAEYENKRADILRQIADLQGNGVEVQDHTRQQAQSAREFYASENEAEQDYYRQRSKLAEDYSIDIQRMEEDHQRKMRELAADHNLRMETLADARDALGMYREQIAYEKDRAAAEEDYRVEASRRAEDFARRMAEMEQEFAVARSRRMQDYQQRRSEEDQEFALRQARAVQRLQEELAQLDAQYKAEQEQLTKQQAEKLKQFDAQYQQEKSRRQAAFNDQLRELGVALYNETKLKMDYWNYQAQALQNYINAAKQQSSNMPGYGTNANSTTGTYHNGGRAAGGYVGYGLYRVGEEGEEYVLNARTTRAMERAAGSRLTQAGVLSMIVGGGRSMNVSNTFNVQGQMDNATERRLLRAAERMFDRKLTEAFQ